MSWRNVVSTSYLYAKPKDIKKLHEVLKQEFRWVHKHSQKGYGYFVMMERDLGDWEMENVWMDEIADKLHNIIQHNWELVVNWETGGNYHKRYAWKIKGYLEDQTDTGVSTPDVEERKT